MILQVRQVWTLLLNILVSEMVVVLLELQMIMTSLVVCGVLLMISGRIHFLHQHSLSVRLDLGHVV